MTPRDLESGDRRLSDLVSDVGVSGGLKASTAREMARMRPK
jgi:hypothetical protein